VKQVIAPFNFSSLCFGLSFTHVLISPTEE
jgi:hypothetical protein